MQCLYENGLYPERKSAKVEANMGAKFYRMRANKNYLGGKEIIYNEKLSIHLNGCETRIRNEILLRRANHADTAVAATAKITT